jgi:hypothetical protein
VCFIVRKTISELERTILTTLFLAGAKNTGNDLGIKYCSGKANVVADTLSQRSYANHFVVKSIPSELCDEFAELKLVANTEVMEMEVGSSLLQEIQKGQLEDEKI